jgi:hypothetical protein
VELAGDLAGTYDVISMFHDLEHTLDPKAELAAAAQVRRPGGYLAIELPDPECRWNRLLGKYWLPWLQPQHLHLMPIANLCEEAQELGFAVVDQQRGEPHFPIDVTAAVMLWSSARFGCEDVPWEPAPPSTARKLFHKVGAVATLPFMVAATVIDKRSATYARRHGYSNAYRVLLTTPSGDEGAR